MAIMVPEEVLSFINDHKRFLISSHINPDGDGLGSALGLKWILNHLNKEARIVVDSPAPEMYQFFTGYDLVERYIERVTTMKEPYAAIIVDAPNLERLGLVKAIMPEQSQVMCIDHHISNEAFGQVNFLDNNAAASAEMVYRIAKALELEIDSDFAEYIYTGILVDTGQFRFSNTSSSVLTVAAELVAAGAKPNDIAEHVFHRNTFETTLALGKFLGSIRLHFDGKLATGEFDHETISHDSWKNVDTEGFVNHPLAIVGVEVAAFFREVEPKVTRVSLRAKHDFDVNELANVFGGGGHAKAAGLTIKVALEKAKKTLLDEVAKRFDI